MAALKEVLLLKRVSGWGAEGELVRVRPGFARNYLVPNQLAIVLEKSNPRQANVIRKKIEKLRKDREAREARELAAAECQAEKARALRPVISVRTGENGTLFGSVSATDIQAKLQELGLEIDRDMLRLDHPIKTLGQHMVDVVLHRDVTVQLTLEIVSENPVLGSN